MDHSELFRAFSWLAFALLSDNFLRRARVVLSDDRNEFIRLRQTVTEREVDASGASGASLRFRF